MTRIIDADGHVVEPRALWGDYAEPQFRDRMIQMRRNRDGRDELFIDGENRSRPSLPVAASMTPGGLSDLEARANPPGTTFCRRLRSSGANQGDGRRRERRRGALPVAVAALWRPDR